ncbi:MAG: hypothetical protein KDB96_17370, partial [Flavobacteriales bacterium]|nr:hypothetical protein [Flavobacteriales bacterium]
MNAPKILLATLAVVVLLPACVSKKKYTAIQLSNQTLNEKLAEANRQLDACRGDKSVLEARVAEIQNKNEHLKDQVAQLN